MAAVKHYYDVDFAFKELGLMYHLYNKFPSQGFDLINVSGLLYHVFSPLMVLSGIRPLLKKNGLIIVSTNVIYDDSFRWNSITQENASRGKHILVYLDTAA
jgi:SAM-dependent methyltransferase